MFNFVDKIFDEVMCNDFKVNDVVVSIFGEPLVVVDVLIDGWGVTHYRVRKYESDTPLTILYSNCDLKKKKHNFLRWCINELLPLKGGASYRK